MKNLKYLALLILLMGFNPGMAQERKSDEQLEQKLKEITSGFRGDLGIYVYNLKTGAEAGINQDTLFPTASVIKVPILLGVFKKITSGELAYNQPLTYNKERAYGGSGLMQFYEDSTATDLRTTLGLMMAYSDNTTSLWNQELSGGGTEINKLLEELGYEHTRVNSRTEGRKEIWEKYGWGQTTPREMANILVEIRNGNIFSKAASEEMYRIMTNSFYTDDALSQIPPYVETASKQGMVSDSRSELLLVNAPSGDYVFYFTTKDIEDQSWEYDNEAAVLVRKVSAFLWNYFEPESNWKPAEGIVELTTSR